MAKQPNGAARDDKKSTGPASAEEASGTLPLFFSAPVPLDPERHAQATIRMNLPLHFARTTNSIPIAVSEFAEAAKSYPIVFSGNPPYTPMVVVGLEKANLFVDEKGAWRTDCYVPAYVRKYPFVFMEVPNNDTMILCVDEGAEHFSAKGGKESDTVRRLFGDDGKPTPYTQEALSFCTAFQQEHLVTRRLGERLHGLGLLKPNQSEARLADGRQVRLGGFQLIDEAAFGTLPDATIVELLKEGSLALMFACFLSNSNWQRLLNYA